MAQMNSNECSAQAYSRKLLRFYRELKLKAERGEKIFEATDPFENDIRKIIASSQPKREEVLAHYIKFHLRGKVILHSKIGANEDLPIKHPFKHVVGLLA